MGDKQHSLQVFDIARNTVPLTLHREKMEASPGVSQTLPCSCDYLLAILSL
jgi:hypothetical protein